jgi:predicted transcriptional regulator
MRKVFEKLQKLEAALNSQSLLSKEDLMYELRLLSNFMTDRKSFAKELGISRWTLKKVLEGERPPGPAIRKFLHVEKVKVNGVTMYQRVGKRGAFNVDID